MRAARRSSMTTCARCGRCLLPPPRTFQRTVYRPGELPVRSVRAARGDPGRLGPDAPRLGRDVRAGLLARVRRRAGVLQGVADIAVRDAPLPVAAGGAAGEAGLGPRGRDRTPRRPPDRARSPPSAASSRVGWVILRAGDCAGQGRVERLQGFLRRQLRARPALRERARLPGPARRLVRSQVNARVHTTTARASPIERLAEERELMRAAARGDARHRPALGDARPAGALPALRHATTTRSTRAWSAAASRCASRQREVTAVALDTGELACRHARVVRRRPRRSPPSSTRPRSSAARRAPPRPRASTSSSARWPAMTR